GVCGPASNAAQRAQRRRAKFGELAIGQRFYARDPFQDRLKKDGVVTWAGLETRRQRRIGDREAFAWRDERVVIEPSWLVGPESRGERHETVARKEAFNDPSACVG